MKSGVAFCLFLSFFSLSYGFFAGLTQSSDSNEVDDDALAKEEVERNRLNFQNLQDRFTLNLPRPFTSMNLFANPLISFTVRPNPCNTTSGREGYCHSRRECNVKGGIAEGSCARGIGVCCLLEQRCGAIVKANNSVLVNDNYPSDTTDIGNCQYIIDKMNANICQMRLDFEEFSLLGPNPANTLCERDTFTVVGTAGDNPQVICGENTGQHMYIDLASGFGSARINIAMATPGAKRSWRIKVSQIECNSPYRAPQNCLQYYTKYSDVISSFNYKLTNGSNHIGGLSYSACVKSREGYCGIMYQSSNFSVSGNNDINSPVDPIIGEDFCQKDFISIFTQDKNGQVLPSRYCGNAFNHTTTFAKPFIVRVITDFVEDRQDTNNRGFLIRYTQVPC